VKSENQRLWSGTIGCYMEKRVNIGIEYSRNSNNDATLKVVASI
jgi:hypothetical protein